MSGSGGTHFHLYVVKYYMYIIYVFCIVFKRLQFTNVNIIYIMKNNIHNKRPYNKNVFVLKKKRNVCND